MEMGARSEGRRSSTLPRSPRARQPGDPHARRLPVLPTRRQVGSVAMRRKTRLSLLQTATRQTSAIVHPP